MQLLFTIGASNPTTRQKTTTTTTPKTTAAAPSNTRRISLPPESKLLRDRGNLPPRLMRASRGTCRSPQHESGMGLTRKSDFVPGESHGSWSPRVTCGTLTDVLGIRGIPGLGVGGDSK